jgi:hypothetical protein
MGNLTYGSNTSWVRLYTRDTRLLRLTDDLWGDGLMQIQRHEVVYIWLDGAETVPV